MMEVIHTYGSTNHLQGIASIADASSTKPWVLILNAGVVHKVGPFNIHIDLIRHLAARGFNCFRFDLSGQGDSGKSPKASSNENIIVDDIRATMDRIENQYGSSSFIVMGLCTGADNAQKAALIDKRIRALVALDGYGYPTTKFRLFRYLPVLTNPHRLLHAITSRFKKSDPVNTMESNSDGVQEGFLWHLPPKHEFATDMNQLHQRQVKFLYIYTGGVREYYNYQDQFYDGFKKEPFIKSVTVHLMAETDHTFSLHHDRRILLSSISSWLETTLLPSA